MAVAAPKHPSCSHTITSSLDFATTVLHKSFRGVFLFPSKLVDLKNKGLQGGGVTVTWCHAQSISSRFSAAWAGAPGQQKWGVRTSTPFCSSSSHCHEMAARTHQKRHKSTQPCRIHPNCLKIPCK